MKRVLKEQLAVYVVDKLIEKHLKISTVESCTGGMVASTLVDVAGVSEVFGEGYITYSNEAKMKLVNVSEETLELHGAVSEEVASEMAIGCAENANSEIAIATTGIAGPDGGTEKKPVGLVYIACYFRGNIVVEKNIFKGSRTQVREETVLKALDMVSQTLKYNT